MVQDVSPDQRFVLLRTQSTNLVEGLTDDNGVEDLVVFDRQTGLHDWITGSASRPGHSAVAGDPGVYGALSDDGRYVAYSTASRDAAPGVSDENFEDDVFLFDRVARTTTLVSHVEWSATGANTGSFSHLSADGRWVLYRSRSSLLVPGSDQPAPGTSSFSTAKAAIEPGFHQGRLPRRVRRAWRGPRLRFSADGRWVLYLSISSNLVDAFVDGNGPAEPDAFLYDRVAGPPPSSPTLRGSATAAPPRWWALSQFTSLDLAADGGSVIFAHPGSDLVPGYSGPAGKLQLYYFERATGAIRLLSGANGSATAGGNGNSSRTCSPPTAATCFSRAWPPTSIPASCRRPSLLRGSTAPTSAPAPFAGQPPGRQADTPACCLPIGEAMTDDGRYILYSGAATGVVAGQMERRIGFPLRPRHRPHPAGRPPARPAETRGSRRRPQPGARPDLPASWDDLSGDAPAGDPPSFQVFAFERASGGVTRITSSAAAGHSAGRVQVEDIAFVGPDLLFHSVAGDLVAGFVDTNWRLDPFLFRAADSSLTPLLAAASELVGRPTPPPPSPCWPTARRCW